MPFTIAAAASTTAEVTAATVAADAAITAAALSAASTIQQGQYAEKVGEYNMQVAQQEAESAKVASEYETREQRIEKRKELARQLVLAAKGGVVPSAGTPLTIRSQTAADYETEIGKTQYGYSLAGQQAISQGLLEKSYGRQKKRASRWQAGSTALTGAGMGLNYRYGS